MERASGAGNGAGRDDPAGDPPSNADDPSSPADDPANDPADDPDTPSNGRPEDDGVVGGVGRRQRWGDRAVVASAAAASASLLWAQYTDDGAADILLALLALAVIGLVWVIRLPRLVDRSGRADEGGRARWVAAPVIAAPLVVVAGLTVNCTVDVAAIRYEEAEPQMRAEAERLLADPPALDQGLGCTHEVSGGRSFGHLHVDAVWVSGERDGDGPCDPHRISVRFVRGSDISLIVVREWEYRWSDDGEVVCRQTIGRAGDPTACDSW